MSTKPEPFLFEDNYYYNLKDLFNYDSSFFSKNRCKSTPKKIIEKMKLEEKEYIFASYNKNQNKWYLDKTNKSQLLLSQNWVIAKFFSNNETNVKNNEVIDSIESENNISSSIISHKINYNFPEENDFSRITPKILKLVFNLHTSNFSCIYLFSFGKVEIVREIFKIPSNIKSDSIVYKFGSTDNILSKLKDFESFFKEKNEKVEISLCMFNFVDNKYINHAKQELCEECNIYQNIKGKEKDLILLNGEKEFEKIKKQYNKIGKQFANENLILDLQNKIKFSEIEKKISEEKCLHKEEVFKLKEDNYKLQILLLQERCHASNPLI
jgi:hypothetical protein